MKKLSRSLCLAIVMALAQFVNAQNFSVGPRVGVNFATLTSDHQTLESNTSFAVGVTSTYSINQRIGLGVDVLYSKEGAKGDVFGDLTLDYIRVPVVFQYFLRDLEDDFRPKVYLGFAPGFLVNAAFAERETADNYRSLDLAKTLGLGFNYRLSDKGIWLNVDMRFLHGSSKISDQIPEWRNRQWQFSIGLAYGY